MIKRGQDREGPWVLVMCDGPRCPAYVAVRPGSWMTRADLVDVIVYELAGAAWGFTDDGQDGCAECASEAGQGRSLIGGGAAHP